MTAAHMIVCDVCGRGPSKRVYVMPRWVPKIRSERETLAWARAAGRRIGLEIRREIELDERLRSPVGRTAHHDSNPAH
jgi:hypothetical protein